MTIAWQKASWLTTGETKRKISKGERVVGKYNASPGEGLTVIKSPNVTEEVQNK